MINQRQATLNSPLVTVIIPAYNYQAYLGQTIESVLSQTLIDYECIVVDDGSTDNTRELVSEYIALDPRIKYIYQNNQGLAAARNTGIRNCKGEYLQFLDADDLIESRKLENQAGFLNDNPCVDIVYGSVRFFSTESPNERLYSMWGDTKPWIPELHTQNDHNYETLTILLGKTMPVNTPLVRKSVFNDIGLFDTSLSQAEDWDFWIRCAAWGKQFEYLDVDESLALVRYHDDSMSKSRRIENIEQIIKMRRKNHSLLHDGNASELNQRYMIENEGYLAIERIAAGHLLAGLKGMFKTAMKTRNIREKGKWFACTLMAPFISPTKLRKMPSTPIL